MIKQRKNLIMSSLSIITLGLLLLFLLPQKNTRESTSIQLDTTSSFTKEELHEAVDTTISFFNHNWKGATLHSVSFDNHFYENAMTNKVPGTTLYSDLDDDNTLIMTINFTTGNKTDGSMSPNMLIDDWQIILSRSSKNDPWQVIDQGV